MSGRAREGYQGTGPGAITPDGCAVDRWLRLPVGREPDVVAAAAGPGASILELGCGVGRVTRPLVERGFAVTAVDESPEMLAHVGGAARTVCSPVETLELGEERFDVVLLASFLVHNGDPAVRRGMLATCRRYVADGGAVLIEREGDDWHTRVPREGPSPDGGVTRVVSADPVGPDVSSIRVEYEFADARWSQTFLSYRYRGDAFERTLAEAGLRLDTTLTEDGTWVRALPV
ncbi:class I SAM-dependent methyltransferase [Streptomyces sp. SBT349]|uniref:class I SAM-dependent methyltransferase n=1 Tax=Streptomyces sp. SBT349 TaxID=1580539 RepID=UPI00066B9E32|nr:class I SAM-dependent methyltransferase [Streptomyces sp. SBT349]